MTTASAVDTLVDALWRDFQEQYAELRRLRKEYDEARARVLYTEWAMRAALKEMKRPGITVEEPMPGWFVRR